MRTVALIAAAFVMLSTPAHAGTPWTGSSQQAVARQVQINNVRLTDADLAGLDGALGTRVQDGNYWYDATSGLWGVMGGGPLGLVAAGLRVGGPLPANASGGGTRVFINGREISMVEAQALMQLYGMWPQAGRYTLYGNGALTCENGAMITNLYADLQRASARGGQSSTWHDGSTTRGGGYYDNGDSYYSFTDKATGKSYSWGSDGSTSTTDPYNYDETH